MTLGRAGVHTRACQHPFLTFAVQIVCSRAIAVWPVVWWCGGVQVRGRALVPGRRAEPAGSLRGHLPPAQRHHLHQQEPGDYRARPPPRRRHARGRRRRPARERAAKQSARGQLSGSRQLVCTVRAGKQTESNWPPLICAYVALQCNETEFTARSRRGRGGTWARSAHVQASRRARRVKLDLPLQALRQVGSSPPGSGKPDCRVCRSPMAPCMYCSRTSPRAPVWPRAH